jgi:PKD repeat protein
MDDSFFGPTTWNWTFEGGSPSNSIEQNPTITYTEPGLYSVSLTSGDGTDSDVVTKNAFIRVLPSTTVLPFMESFEEYTTLSDAQGKWVSRNPGENNTWEVYDGAGHTGNKSVRIMNIGQPSGGIDELISGSFDLSDLSSSEDITLTFRYSFKQRSSSNDDRLRILASADCGETWATRRQILSSTLSLGTQATSWTPASQDDWVTNHVTNITSSYFVDGMRFKFEWQHGGGNNIFLDDINLYKGSSDPLSILEQTAFGSDAQLFPNPSIGELTVRVSITDALDFDVNIIDLSGKQLQSFRIQGKQGTNDIMLQVDDLAQGMYMVELLSSSGKTVKQFVKN